MRQIIKNLIAFCLFGYGTLSIAQNVIPASGGNATGAGGSVSYSVGQVTYTTNNGTNGSVAQGVQQPYEISVVTAIEEATGILLELSVYPNPATDFATLKTGNYEGENMNYLLFDINGKVLLQNKVEGSETMIPLSDLAKGTYFLKIIDKKRELKIFKIIKN